MLGCFVQFLPQSASRLNTQAHLLIAAALLCRSSNARPNLPAQRNDKAYKVWPVNAAVLIGALIPDISLFLMFAQARLRGIDDEVIWGELYYSVFWQNIGAITNSVPIYLALVIAGLLLTARMRTQATAVFALGMAALLHCLTDLPLHVDDGHAHFWPFTTWIYESSISYWDPDHYGNYWQPIEFFIAGVAALIIWRRFQSIGLRTAVLTGLMSYPAMLVFWFYMMH